MNYVFLAGCICIMLAGLSFFKFLVSNHAADVPKKVRLVIGVLVPLFLSLGVISFIMGISGIPLLASGVIFVGSAVKVNSLFALLTLIYLVGAIAVSTVVWYKNRKVRFSSVENME